jgi:plastocyanin
MKSFSLRLLVALSALVLVTGACAKKTAAPTAAPPTTESDTRESSSPADAGGGTITVDGKSANYRGTSDITQSKDLELEVGAANYAFSPTVIEGKPGLKGIIGIHNESDTLHNFSIDADHINKDVSPGSEEEIPVTFPKSGVLIFYCKYHQTSGMRGVLDTTGGSAIDMSGATGTSSTTQPSQAGGGQDQSGGSGSGSGSGGNKGY